MQPRSDEGSSSLPTDQGKLETTPINAAHGWAELEAEKEKPEEFVFAPSEPAKGHKYYQRVKRRSVKVARSPVFDMCWNPATVTIEHALQLLTLTATKVNA